ncbi:hypothetical protein V1512DRAFT_247457 [Lipomyces arxii]|uniref:uncharacterized protein n=1 Tax=Lipomyces arxii TaxID=56418 RepID=UPI0034CFAFC1
MAFEHLLHMSFRFYIEALKEDCDLVEINEECHFDFEVGAIIRKVVESKECAPLFSKLKGQNENGLWHILGTPNCLRSDPKQNLADWRVILTCLFRRQ